MRLYVLKRCKKRPLFVQSVNMLYFQYFCHGVTHVLNGQIKDIKDMYNIMWLPNTQSSAIITG